METGTKYIINSVRDKLSTSQFILLNIIIVCVIVVFAWSDAEPLAMIEIQLDENEQSIYSEYFDLNITSSMTNLWKSSMCRLSSPYMHCI